MCTSRLARLAMSAAYPGVLRAAIRLAGAPCEQGMQRAQQDVFEGPDLAHRKGHDGPRMWDSRPEKAAAMPSLEADSFFEAVYFTEHDPWISPQSTEASTVEGVEVPRAPPLPMPQQALPGTRNKKQVMQNMQSTATTAKGLVVCNEDVDPSGQWHVLFTKTQLCKFNRRGRCRRGVECQFAHSDKEKRSTPDLSKTVLCRLWRQGACPHTAELCSFAHGLAELRPSIELPLPLRPPFGSVEGLRTGRPSHLAQSFTAGCPFYQTSLGHPMKVSLAEGTFKLSV